MSNDQSSKLCVLILKDMFDEAVSQVGANLLDYGVKTLGQICSSSGLCVKEVKRSLVLLVEHNLVTFTDKRKPGQADYKISKPNIINMMFYPFYSNLVCGEQEGKDLPPESASAWGAKTSALLQAFLIYGRLKASQAILHAFNSLNQDEESCSIQDLLKSLGALSSSKIIISCPTVVQTDDVPKFEEENKVKSLPSFDVTSLEAAILQGNLESIKDTIYWKPNEAVLSQKYRDSIITSAAVRRVDDIGGRIVRSILDLSAELHDPWSPTSGHMGMSKIGDRVRRDWSSLVTHADQYLTILTSDRTRFVDKVGDSGGGQYQVNYKHILTELTAATVEQIILERFGSKSMRIFRFIREKKYVEENQIQQVVMIPSKEAKLLTYQLMENNFICLQELKKTINATTPSKALYLFYVNFNQVVRYCLNLSLHTLYNLKKRSTHELGACARLIEKRDKVHSIMESLRAQGGTEDQLAEVAEMISPPEVEELKVLDNKMNQCSLAEIKTLNTLFIMQTFLRYQHS
jgi:DNA-directed RNA polymerase III subunit RPC3